MSINEENNNFSGYGADNSKNMVRTEKQKTASNDDLDDYVFQKPVHHRHHGKEKMKRWKKALIIILISLIVILVALISMFFIFSNIGRSQLLSDRDDTVLMTPDGVESRDNGKYVVYNGKKYEYNENITSVLFMGVDKENLETNTDDFGKNGDADVLLLFTFDTVSGKTNLVSISRDTMSDVDVFSTEGNYVGTKIQQICLAYSYGDGRETSCENQVDAVRKLFYNVPINSYFALDLSAINVLNDTVGGVTVEALETFGPFVEGETVTLHGTDAEKYVRTRNTKILESNNMRMERQKQYIRGFFDRVVYETKQNIMTPVDLFNEASPYMVTNIGVPKVTYLAENVLNKNFYELNMQNVPGEVKQGDFYAEYYVDEDSFYEMFLNIYYTPV